MYVCEITENLYSVFWVQNEIAHTVDVRLENTCGIFCFKRVYSLLACDIRKKKMQIVSEEA